MTRYAFVDTVFTNTAVEVSGEFVGPDGRQYPRNWLELTTAQEKAAIGLKAVAEVGVVPAGKRAIGRELVVADGQPVEQWILEDIPTPELAAAKLQAVRERRWAAETAGVVVGGTSVRTDERSQTKISGALQLFALNPALTAMDWEAQPGEFVAITQGQLEAIGLAVGAHIQACFTRSKALTEEILAARDNADRAALLAVDIETGWPA